VARANPGHPRLLIFDNPFQGINGVLLFPDLLLETVETLQDQSHVDAHLVDLLSMTVHPTGDVVNFLLVVPEGLFLGKDIGLELRFQSIALLHRQFVA